MKKNKIKVLVLLSLIVVVSCASNIKTKSFGNESLYRFKTYAFLPENQSSISEFNRKFDSSIDKDAVLALKNKMKEKGFTLDKNNPDLVVLISHSININDNLKKDAFNNKTASSSSQSNVPYSASSGGRSHKRYFGSGTSESKRPYKKGYLVVELFDNNTKDLVWYGMIKDFKTDITDQGLSVRMVNEIFKEFPTE